MTIAITTFYKDPAGKDKVRFDCAQRLVDLSVMSGYPTVVVDDSPDPMVAKELSDWGALVFRQQRKGMGASKREAALHAIALGSDIVVMNEAEKINLFEHIDTLVCPIVQEQSEIVVAKRTSASDHTCPALQVITEKAADDAFEQITGLIGIRPMFGPVAFHAQKAGIYFTGFHPAEVPGLPDTYIQHYGPVVAVYESKGNVRVSSAALDFRYPADQKEEEEASDNEAIRQKRFQQRDSLVQAYQVLVNHLKK